MDLLIEKMSSAKYQRRLNSTINTSVIDGVKHYICPVANCPDPEQTNRKHLTGNHYLDLHHMDDMKEAKILKDANVKKAAKKVKAQKEAKKAKIKVYHSGHLRP